MTVCSTKTSEDAYDMTILPLPQTSTAKCNRVSSVVCCLE